MKAAALSRAFQKYPQFEEIIVHSGQHYDDALSGDFFHELNLKSPKYHMQIGSGTANYQIGQFLINIDAIFESEKPDLVIVYGDTNTTAAGAIAASKNNIPLAHVEAGLREWNKEIPEEINKLITDAVSDIFFCPSRTGVQNLKKMGVFSHVYMTGDITLDLLADNAQYTPEKEFKKDQNLEEEYLYFTCHRVRNTDFKDHLKEIVDFLNAVDKQVIWPIHPRTKRALKKFELQINNPKIRIIDPIGYWLSQHYIKYAKAVVTDSGGVTKEAYFHHTPGILIDLQTEWVETTQEGWNVITGPDCQAMLFAIDHIHIPTYHSSALGNGQAGIQMVEAILGYLEAK